MFLGIFSNIFSYSSEIEFFTDILLVNPYKWINIICILQFHVVSETFWKWGFFFWSPALKFLLVLDFLSTALHKVYLLVQTILCDAVEDKETSMRTLKKSRSLLKVVQFLQCETHSWSKGYRVISFLLLLIWFLIRFFYWIFFLNFWKLLKKKYSDFY